MYSNLFLYYILVFSHKICTSNKQYEFTIIAGKIELSSLIVHCYTNSSDCHWNKIKDV